MAVFDARLELHRRSAARQIHLSNTLLQAANPREPLFVLHIVFLVIVVDIIVAIFLFNRRLLNWFLDC